MNEEIKARIELMLDTADLTDLNAALQKHNLTVADLASYKKLINEERNRKKEQEDLLIKENRRQARLHYLENGDKYSQVINDNTKKRIYNEFISPEHKSKEEAYNYVADLLLIQFINIENLERWLEEGKILHEQELELKKKSNDEQIAFRNSERERKHKEAIEAHKKFWDGYHKQNQK
jgi:hypothetical protein